MIVIDLIFTDFDGANEFYWQHVIDSEVLIIQNNSLSRQCYRSVNKLDEVAWNVNASVDSTQCDLIEELVEDLKRDLLAALNESEEVSTETV